MIRPLECFIGLRYLRTGSGRGLVSFMSFASVAGIMLGVASIIVILSAMNGLEGESRRRLLSMTEHLTLRPAAGGPVDLDQVTAAIRATAGVTDVAPFIQFEAVLRRGREFGPVVVRGVDPRAEAGSELETAVGRGLLERLEPGGNRILLGRYVAANLETIADDVIEVMLPQAAAGQVEMRRSGVRVAGAFAAGIEAHDSNLALMHIRDASRLAGIDDGAPALAVRLGDPMDVARIEQALAARLGPGFEWSNWASENQSLFRAMAIEKTMMTILMMFIVAVAAFNIVTSLTMVVNEKAKDIAILRTLGLAPRRVTRVFLVQGAVLGIGGTLAGVGTGYVLARNLELILPWLETTFGFQIMPGDVFYVQQVPSDLRLKDFLLVPGFALLLSVFATLLPSRRAARIDPADVLRYE